MAKSNSRSTLSYRLLTWGLFPAAFLYTGYIAFKSRNRDYFTQRLGLYKKANSASQIIWCHCASVGEINTALPLLRSLIKRGEHLLISTNTVTGKQAVINAKLDNTEHVFYPLDYSVFARQLITEFTPRLHLLFETELWSSTILAVADHNIPIAIINGRISEKTLKAPALILGNYKKSLQEVDLILASSEENAIRFKTLGARPDRINTLDNLKFAGINTPPTVTEECPLDFPFLLCASTHQGEEQLIIERWKLSAPENLGLVIAIRHPHRKKELCKLLNDEQLPYHLHSSCPENPSSNEIYIIDTLGQLMPFMKNAAFVFMGGSLVPVGGHNVVEPAQFGRCILIGPYHDDFKDIVNELVKCEGIILVNNASQLIEEIERLLKDYQEQVRLGENAKNYLDSKTHVLKNYQDLVFKLIDEQSS